MKMEQAQDSTSAAGGQSDSTVGLGVKVFSFQHLFFNSEETYTETEMPSWMTHRETQWFLDKHVLTLKVGEFVNTDFRRITRVN
jgi:hypothetical protein